MEVAGGTICEGLFLSGGVSCSCSAYHPSLFDDGRKHLMKHFWAKKIVRETAITSWLPLEKKWQLAIDLPRQVLIS